ncbi:hypothetical protein T8J41_12535 [Nitratireductor rhodophyticola]|uniref:hypothetical protein n=1 Tax=Nitratireductor TaxID=245876 RepID=UPI0012FE066A|nr:MULTISPECIES: hypothetical protein [Nitratireductor]WPZ13003.1 hypothetical protein T8J41_12535 [Nitratireductor rhodophyticola]
MMITVEVDGVELKPHWYDADAKGLKRDRFGKLGGYRLHPSGDGHNKSELAIFYKSLEDVAQHLVANRDWGLRFTTVSGPSNIFYNEIRINGVLR